MNEHEAQQLVYLANLYIVPLVVFFGKSRGWWNSLGAWVCQVVNLITVVIGWYFLTGADLGELFPWVILGSAVAGGASFAVNLGQRQERRKMNEP